MPDYYAHHAKALAAVEAQLGDVCPVITWGGENYKVITGSAHRRKDLASGGFSLNADLVFEAYTATFTSDDLPTVVDVKYALLSTLIGYLGDSYKVVSISIRPGGNQFMVECNSEGQSA